MCRKQFKYEKHEGRKIWERTPTGPRVLGLFEGINICFKQISNYINYHFELIIISISI